MPDRTANLRLIRPELDTVIDNLMAELGYSHDTLDDLLTGLTESITGEVLAAGDGTTLTFTGALAQPPLVRFAHTITDGVESFEDNGDGTLAGNFGGYGTLDYATGAYSLTFNAPPSSNVTADYLRVELTATTQAAQAAATEAEHWATYPEDQQVPEGGAAARSSLHYAAKAEGSAAAAAASEANAATSESRAAASESAAASSESGAANSASAAAASESNAATSAGAAATSEANAAAHYDAFRGTYYGKLVADPSADPNGDPVEEGDWYFNTTDKRCRVFDGAAWGYTSVDAGSFVTRNEAPVGGYVFVQSDLGGAAEPDSAYFIRLSAGLTGAGQYNEGKLTSESVSGSAPYVDATAVIADAGSPLNGQTVRLLETERRFLRAGSPGTLQDDALKSHYHQYYINVQHGDGQVVSGESLTAGIQVGGKRRYVDRTEFAGDTETRPRNIGAAVYMRIK